MSEVNIGSLYPTPGGINGINNTIDPTISHDPTNLMVVLPSNFMSLMNYIFSTVEHTSNEISRNRKKCKLMKVCVNYNRSPLDKMMTKEKISYLNDCSAIVSVILMMTIYPKKKIVKLTQQRSVLCHH